VQDPQGDVDLAAAVGEAYNPEMQGHYLLIPDKPDGVNSNEQATFQALGKAVAANPVVVGTVTKETNWSGSGSASPAPQSSSIVAAIANAMWAASVVVVKSVAEVSVALFGSTLIGGPHRMMAF